MFCFQCQETVKNSGCTIQGVCGKKASTAGLQDLLIFQLKGISALTRSAGGDTERTEAARFISKCLFSTITNANFDNARFHTFIQEGEIIRKKLYDMYKAEGLEENDLPAAAVWSSADATSMESMTEKVGVMSESDEDIRSLKELILYGLKGIAAYTHHAFILGFESSDIYNFYIQTLSSLLQDLDTNDLIALVMATGEQAVAAMALLDKANTDTYGNPEITKVNIGTSDKPGILISGHDLKVMEELLKQTAGTGVDVYTHGEMLPANYYPAFKKYDHFIGNYGGSWWHQAKEFESFNGPILMTTNCIVPVKDSYKDRIYTADIVGYPGVKHLSGSDYSELVEQAKNCPPPTELETGEIVGGFAHNQVIALADKVVEAVKSGAIKRFVVMAGCDGRQKDRSYFTEVAEELPKDTIILTAGCAKYRYNKLDLGDIGGIPRVLDAGQCNDSYSLAVIALKLKEVFELEDVNDLPLSFDIAWYEQKAVAVLLALLHLGFKGIRLGPTLPAFVSPGVAKVLVENFNIKPVTDAKSDVEAMMAGR